jgi:hypothetical protein
MKVVVSTLRTFNTVSSLGFVSVILLVISSRRTLKLSYVVLTLKCVFILIMSLIPPVSLRDKI